jgi:hypothetical protein
MTQALYAHMNKKNPTKFCSVKRFRCENRVMRCDFSMVQIRPLLARPGYFFGCAQENFSRLPSTWH